MIDMQDFSNVKNNAINELFKMSQRASKNGCLPPANSEKCDKSSTDTQSFSIGNDELLVLGLVLILSNDCSDRWLFLALLYILL